MHPLNPKQVAFANALRGVAALSIVVSHYCGVYWLSRPVVGALTDTYALPITYVAPTYVTAMLAIPAFNLGSFGVALFFVISGFVIPFSLETYRPVGFLVGRIFRLWPSYVIGFGITILAVNWSRTDHFPYSLYFILIHAIPGLRDLAGVPSIDGIIWTLEIEIKFYLVAAIVAKLLRAGSLLVYLVPATFVAISLLIQPNTPSTFLHALWFDGPFLAFMFTGVALNYLQRRLITGRVAIFICSSTLLVVLTGFVALRIQAQFPSYVLALAIFSAAMALPRFAPNRGVLRFVAEISYPLYVVHAVAGYVLMTKLIVYARVPTWLAPFVVAAAAIVVAAIIHRMVEVPTHSWGRKLARRLSADLAERHVRIGPPPNAESLA